MAHNIKLTRKTSMGNPIGWRVRINGKAYDIFCLDRDEAFVKALKKHLDLKSN